MSEFNKTSWVYVGLLYAGLLKLYHKCNTTPLEKPCTKNTVHFILSKEH